ncbi:unnamed protein product (macronuclear) [Paramecium tetraurelia]|uniref:Nudix hydrolase domain-containing protein n=1 Tax=Paramecium tetraurelia TaxID=5888 RepID=A0C030_PARTE|nr:uncharacterized protein GSPATT00006000001 [Paramecium tetraurelia]CAK64147.1 unnamed protein product [Paramecium tetraurelia]|eukprot:XP_001431545.1 hypothetical protein (macronuclear) [Paramecium tetraurelia strain d4-2]
MKKIMSAMLLAHSFGKISNFDNVIIDSYKGCHIKSNLNQYINNPTLFKQHLIDFIKKSKSNNNTAIWVDLQKDQLRLAPTLIEQGFKMHRVSANILQFSKWLPDCKSRLPDQSTHYVGVGGIVVKGDSILLVQEKNGQRKGAWGTPGGLVDQKESIIQAVLREVKEETNLDCKVEDVLYFREMHDARYGKTDLYFAFRLKCLDEQQIKICDQELMDYRWVPINGILDFMKKENQKPHVINFYKSVQERLTGDECKYMNIEEKEEMYYGEQKYYAIFKPRF